MSRPADLNLRDFTNNLLDSDAPGVTERGNHGNHRNDKNILEVILDKIGRSSPSKSLVLGTLSGWVVGISSMKIGKVAAFGIGGGIILLHLANDNGYIDIHWDRIREATGRCSFYFEKVVEFVKENRYFSAGFTGGFFFGVAYTFSSEPQTTAPVAQPNSESKEGPTNNNSSLNHVENSQKTTVEDSTTFLDKGSLIPKNVPHSPKISPSSIPIPSPSVTIAKHVETGYPKYGGYLYSIPGYSAFQPVCYQKLIVPQNQQPNYSSQVDVKDSTELETFSSTFNAKHSINKDDTKTIEISENISKLTEEQQMTQTDFEDQFTPEVISANIDTIKCPVESKKTLTGFTKDLIATVEIPPNKISTPIVDHKKQTERFILKTSIPISKIDIKSVNSVSDAALSKMNNGSTRVEIHSNIVIKNPGDKESNVKEVECTRTPTINANITALIDAAEALNAPEQMLMKNDVKSETSMIVNVVNEAMKEKCPSKLLTASNNIIGRPQMTIPSNQTPKDVINALPTKSMNKATEMLHNDQKNQILLIQNKNISNHKMLLAISQTKNTHAPSRLHNQTIDANSDSKTTSTPNKVVSLKRLHQDNGDENDFENLITENQIYGNKIVVKEKSQGIQQGQDLKNKTSLKNNTNDKSNQVTETKNLVLQSNFLYVSNVQFPANLMMIKNNTTTNTSELTKVNNKLFENENKSPIETNSTVDNLNIPNVVQRKKEVRMIQTSNNILHSISTENINQLPSRDIVLPGNQKVRMNPQILYQLPMIVEGEVQNISPALIAKDYKQNVKHLSCNKEFSKSFSDTKQNEKVYIACPYRVDSKVQPKIVITNIRSKLAKVEDISCLDLYEKRRRMRRLKHLSIRERTDNCKKSVVKSEKNVITPDKMTTEIYNEFASTKVNFHNYASDTDSEYGGDEIKQYEAIIREYEEDKGEEKHKKIDFLSTLQLATRDVYRDKLLERQEKMLRSDAIATAYVATGRLDRILAAPAPLHDSTELFQHSRGRYHFRQNYLSSACLVDCDNNYNMKQKMTFLSQLKLSHVPPLYKEEYERIWKDIVRDKKMRNNIIDSMSTIAENNKSLKKESDYLELDTKYHLKMLFEIKNSVHENNNLIKKSLDSDYKIGTQHSIHTLALQNISELNRLSILADRSVKLFSGTDTKKRDLNPGFDSENIKRNVKEQHTKINIPNISKIISLKTTQHAPVANISQATSMDEPQNSAGGFINHAIIAPSCYSTTEQPCVPPPDVDRGTAKGAAVWPGIEDVVLSYREFEAARRNTINDLQCRHVQLKTVYASTNRAASRESDRTRAKLAERNACIAKETEIRQSLQRIVSIVEIIRNY